MGKNNFVCVRIVMPDGARINTHFARSHRVSKIYKFVKHHHFDENGRFYLVLGGNQVIGKHEQIRVVMPGETYTIYVLIINSTRLLRPNLATAYSNK